MVTLAFGPDVPRPLLDLVEHHAHHLGLPLHVLEQLGKDAERAEGFILAAEQGLGVAFAMTITYGPPFDRLLDPPSREPRGPPMPRDGVVP